MIESKLYHAAQIMPQPKSSFSQIEERAGKVQPNSTFQLPQYRKVAAILVCVLLLTASVTVAATVEVNYSAWANRSASYSDVVKVTEKVGVILPKALDDSPFYRMTTMYVAPEGTTYLEALTNPAYPWYSVHYGVQDVVREYNSDDPNSGYSESSVVYDEYSISFGSTDHELFRYVFGLDENNVRILDNAVPYSYQTEEYLGITMQIVTEVYDSNNGNETFAYHHRVIWVDTNQHAVFVLHKCSYAEEFAADQMPGEMIEFAKSIIEMNNPIA